MNLSDELSEKDFVREESNKNPYPAWLWLFLLTIVVSLFWGGKSWYGSYIQEQIGGTPFLKVTNRNFSLFLWQNSSYMRVHAKSKEGYLTGFQYMNKVSLEPEFAEKYVVAPPEVLFLYHVWHRLVSAEYTSRPIPAKEFLEFLAYAEEWLPRNWPSAPAEYATMIEALSTNNFSRRIGGAFIDPTNLGSLPEAVLPQQVRMAFQGRKNYFKEGDAINKLAPTFLDLKEFLSTHPHYARNFWRNIVADQYPNYLRTFSSERYEPLSKVPSEEIAPFLRVALYNFMRANEGKIRLQTKFGLPQFSRTRTKPSS